MPERRREYEIHSSVADHEMFLRFVSDDHAWLFDEWLDECGWYAFNEWVRQIHPSYVEE